MKKDNQKKKKMTLDKLAGMVQRGFVDAEERLGNRIDGIEQRLGGVEQRLGGVEQRLDDVVLDVSDLKRGQKEILKKLDEKVERVEFVKVEKRVNVLEKVAVVKQRKD